MDQDLKRLELVARAKCCQQKQKWSRAATEWRRAAVVCQHEQTKNKFLKLADWCDDMAGLVQEIE